MTQRQPITLDPDTSDCVEPKCFEVPAMAASLQTAAWGAVFSLPSSPPWRGVTLGACQMVSKSRTLNRRTFLMTLLSTAIAPQMARGQQGSDPATQEPTGMKIRMTFGGQTMTATLYDSASARDLLSLLPLDLTIEDYSTNEKITYLPRKLTVAGSGPFGNERPGDLCYYAPWGNLALFHHGYRYSAGLIRLGRLDDSFEPLLTRGSFPFRIEEL